MTRVDLHPEDLLDRALNGVASREDMARLEAHFESCNACRLEHALAMDCRRSAATQPEDAELLGRVRFSVVRAFERDKLRAAGYVRRRGPGRFRFIALAAFPLLLGAAGAAVLVRVYGSGDVPAQQPENASTHSSPARKAGPATPVPALAESTSVTEAPPVTEPEPDERRAPRVDRLRPAAEPSRGAAQKPPEASEETASELFAKANSLRRGGQTMEAVRTYRALEQSFPGSPESLVSRVTLGRLLLDRGIDVKAALAEFDAYLSRAPRGPLAEEALIGRALSLGRLGRTAEERTAWSALLASHPRSTYAARARARIEQLSAAQ
jgi:TolA-binding protein